MMMIILATAEFCQLKVKGILFTLILQKMQYFLVLITWLLLNGKIQFW